MENLEKLGFADFGQISHQKYENVYFFNDFSKKMESPKNRALFQKALQVKPTALKNSKKVCANAPGKWRCPWLCHTALLYGFAIWPCHMKIEEKRDIELTCAS